MTRVYVIPRAVRRSYRVLPRLMVCLCIGTLVAHAQTTSPRQIKNDAIVTLKGTSTSDKDLQKKITSVADDISRSLSDKGTNFFLDDWRILPPPQGVTVFDHEQNAADDLTGLLKDDSTPADIRPILQHILDALVQADREIAERSVFTAERLVKGGEGDAKAAARARQQFDQAAKETDPEKEIGGFKTTWQSAQDVVTHNGLVITLFSDGPSFFSSRITPNKLTATFQLAKDQNSADNGNNKDKKDNSKDDKNDNRLDNAPQQAPSQSFEFIEIIQDASTGVTLRRITTTQDVPAFPNENDNSAKTLRWSVTLTSSWDGKDNSGQVAKDGTYNYVAFGRVVNLGDGKTEKGDKKEDSSKDDHTIADAFPITGSMTLDSTPPYITAVSDKPPNAAGWNNTPVTVSFLCTDTTDPVTCPTPIAVTTEGANQRVSGTAVDAAGNTATATLTLSIDMTPPSIAPVLGPLPNQQGWNHSDVTVSFASSDALSGVANVTSPVIVRTEGANQRIAGTAVDVAGNVATAFATINLDKTPPTVTFAAPAPTANAAGWNNTDVKFTYITADNLSGVASTSTANPLVLTGEGTAVSGSVTVTDVAGNMATFSSPPVKIDKTPPMVTVTTPTNGAMLSSPATTVTGTASDTLSGLSTVTCNGVPGNVNGTQFTCGVTLTLGANSINAVARDLADNTNSATVSVTLIAPPPIAVNQSASTMSGTPVNINVLAGDSDPGGNPLSVVSFTQPANGTVTFNGGVARYSPNPGFVGSDQFNYTISNGKGGTATATVSITVNAPPPPPTGPPDPVTVAPPIDPTVPTTLANSTAFLYSGNNPIQTGVAPGTISFIRAAVLKGRVTGRDGTPISGVTIRILNHAEFGQTLTRSDGAFDMAVNGGGPLTIIYEKSGLLPAQRQVNAGWQDYAVVDDVVLISLDTQVTTISANALIMQSARGSVSTDADGSRRPTLLFPAGTSASMVLPDGTVQPLASLQVRATEYTIGSSGPKSMPAALPPTSGYTYAAELSADEALAAGATDVQFNQPIVHYVENFLNFPVGSAVPTGFYDRVHGMWIPSPNGRVIKILSIDFLINRASIDIDGDGIADTGSALTNLGVTDPELQQLAALYAPGQSLWRIPLTHFSPWDCNWPYGLPLPTGPGPAPGPPPPPDPSPDPGDDECQGQGSIINCFRQVLGESVPVTGTGLALYYNSNRVPGRADSRTLQIRLSGATLSSPPPKRIDLEIRIGGRLIQKSYTPAPNLTETFVWDGKDAYGRTVVGWQSVIVRIGNVYDAIYYKSRDDLNKSFAELSGVPLTGNPARLEITIWSESRTSVAFLDAAGMHGLGGWSLSVHHVYDPNGHLIHRGDGLTQTDDNKLLGVINTVAGGGFTASDGVPAVSSAFFNPLTSAVAAPDGSIFALEDDGRIRRIDPNGTITTFAQLATPLSPNKQIAIGPDGSLYASDPLGNKVDRVLPNGTIVRFAGGGPSCSDPPPGCGDAGPATAASIFGPWGVAAAPDGSVYIASPAMGRVRRVAPDGTISTVAGSGSGAFPPTGEDGPATAAVISPLGLAVGPNGLYINAGSRILVVGTDGILRRIAGNIRSICCANDDGSLATTAGISSSSIAVAADGTVYIGDNRRIRIVTTSGLITTAAGSLTSLTFGTEGSPATSVAVGAFPGVALRPDGRLLVVDGNATGTGSGRLKMVGPPLPGLAIGQTLVASPDGSELYVFNSNQHISTLDGLTGTTLFTFGYDGVGRLSSITDADGNATTLERTAASVPTAIVSPYGQRTTLTVDSNGYLSQITDPAGQHVDLATATSGLLQSFMDPRGGPHQFSYDGMGRLISDQDASGHTITLNRTDSSSSFSVDVTKQGQVTSYAVGLLTSGSRRMLTTFPGGGQTEVIRDSSGTNQTTYPDGSALRSSLSPDPRWGMQAPFVSSEIFTTPGGRIQNTTRTNSITLTNPADPLSVRSLFSTATVDGKTVTTSFDANMHSLSFRSPANRTGTSLLDNRGRVLQTQMNGLGPVIFNYGSRGRITNVIQGTGTTARTTSLTYGTAGPAAAYLSSISDALGRQIGFVYDAAGRAVQQTLPGSRTILYGYDAAGNVTSLTPPGRPAYTFTYAADGQLTSIIPPAAPGSAPTVYGYDNLGRVNQITQPDGQVVGLSYDLNGRPSQLTEGSRTINITYQTASGNMQSLIGPAGEEVDYTYDGSLPLSQTWSGPVAGTTSRTLDNALRTASRSVNGSSVNLTYDQDSLLTAVGDLTLTRDSNHGLVTGTTHSNVTDTRTYTSFGELNQYTASTAATTVFGVQYTRDQLGRISAKTEAIGGATDTYTYTYDAAGRLAAIQKNGATTHTYTYDANGNRVTANGIAATYDNQDRLLQFGTDTFVYTPNGFLQTKTTAVGTTSYSYDAIGNLLSVALPGRQIDYLADGLNERIGKKVGGTLVKAWLYDELRRVAAELDGTGALVSRFVYGTRSNVPDYVVKGGAEYRIISDHLGSVRLVVRSSDGSIAQRLDYDPFGVVTNDTSPGFQPFGFAGGLYDSDTGMVRFGARDYDSATGRWTTQDPALFGGGDTNLYAYVLSDPINRFDSNGLDGPGDGGICIGPRPPLPITPAPIILDPKPQDPKPPLCPTCPVPAAPQAPSSGGGGGPITIGPFSFSGGPNTPSISDVRNKDPNKWFNQFDLQAQAPINPDFGLPKTPKDPGGPDPNGPNPKPQGPSCNKTPSHDPGNEQACKGP